MCLSCSPARAHGATAASAAPPGLVLEAAGGPAAAAWQRAKGKGCWEARAGCVCEDETARWRRQR
eukprot:1228450-Alexandrium_andersonii.AAC.1